MSTFPWEVNEENLDLFYSGPHLFGALYRVYRGAYFGQGFQFCEIFPKVDKQFRKNFDRLPLDIKRLILSKIWNDGKNYNKLIVKNGELSLSLKLHFLFAQYGRLKTQTQPIISRGFGAWNGSRIEQKTYVFVYGEQNLKSRVLIPDFITRNPYQPDSVSFGLLCI